MDKQEIHQEVSKAYAEALRRSKEGSGGCCGPQAVCNNPAQLEGYEEHEGAYADAAASSFGCGNPLAFAGVQRGQTVLDLGSGAGLDLLIAAEKVGPSGQVIGVDMTDEMIDAARENAKKAGHDNIDVRKGHIEALPVEDGSVDWVISNCVINLSPDKPKVFSEIARVLKPGGRFSISDIVVEDLPEWVRGLTAAYAACVGGAISEGEYLAGLKGAGLTEVEVTERLKYDADQIRALVHGELENLGLKLDNLPVDPAMVESGLASIDGKVWSAKFSGTR